MRWTWLAIAVACGAPVARAPEPAVPDAYRVASDEIREGPFTNRLAAAASPYLAQHAHNPVDWYPWGEEAFAAARARDVPIFLSIGYAACHWCHVMERESFEDPAVAAYLNAHFVAVKVDREERPDVDAVYMDAVHALNDGHGGWPASLWLTPQGEPFFAGTYFPPVAQRGRPSFRSVLEGIHTAWTTEQQGVREDAARMVESLRRSAVMASSPETPQAALARGAVASMVRSWDPQTAGWGSRKFPMTPRLDAMLAMGSTHGDADALRVVRETLWAMDRGGIHDQIGGGFHRYTVDPAWQIPHFEKMLYDNGQLLSVYASASVGLDEPRFGEVAAGIATWMIREMQDPASGAFYSSQDADTEGVEGATYTWTPAQVQQVLGDDAHAVVEAYAITERGNFEHTNVLVRPQAPPVDEALRARLLAARDQRPQPPTDTKAVVSYNALAISGLSRAGRWLGEPAWVVAAGRAASAVLAARRSDGTLPRTLDADSPDGVLDDYAFLAVALIDLYEATGDIAHLRTAADVVREMDSRLWDPVDCLWFHSADTALIVRKKDVSDGPEPAGVAAAAMAHLRLQAFGADVADSQRIDGALRAAGPWLSRRGAAVPTLARARDMLERPATSFVVAAPDLDAAAPFTALWSERLRADGVLAVVRPTDDVTGFATLQDKDPGAEGARAFLCFDGACRRPAASVEAARAQLDELATRP